MADNQVKIDEYDYFDLATKKRDDGDLVGINIKPEDIRLKVRG